jgi:formylglycine-generating enzyme
MPSRIAGGLFAVAACIALAHDHSGPYMTVEGLITPNPPAHPWQLVLGKFWEIATTESEEPAVTDAAEGTRGACPTGMIEVQGSMHVDSERGSVEYLQDSVCTDWISRDFPERCAKFDQPRWEKIVADLPVRQHHFCVDRFEYPDRKGAYPVIAITWREAGAVCEARGARLCTEDEWTFACEGEGAWPYPTGFVRDEQACVVDRPWKLFDERRLAVRDSPMALAEIDYVWQGEPSGSRPRCRSPFGLYDTTGNVDEWTHSVEHEGYQSILKGGYWGPVRARCRASTRAHNEDFYFYQQGFRCCTDAPTALPVPVPEPSTDASTPELATH